MRTFLRVLGGLVVLIVLGFLHYTLPRQDVVRIVSAEIQRIQTGGSLFYADSESLSPDGTRDVRIINGIRENGRPSVYRNEDTGWGWPPYFKFDSANVQAQAADLTSTSQDPRWVLVKRYGWRSQLFSIYPNAITLRQVEGPGDKPLPWLNVLILAGIGAAGFGIYRVVNRFYERRIDPMVDRVTDVFDGDENEGANQPPAAGPTAEKKGFFARLFGR